MSEFTHSVWLRLKRLFTKKRHDQDLEDELAFHLAMSRGSRPFGNTTQIKEKLHDEWSFAWLESFLADVRYTFRTLRRSPAFTSVAVLSLALGIGANTAVFSLLDSLLLRSMPVRDPERLRVINWKGSENTPFRSHNGSMSGTRTAMVGSSFSLDSFREFLNSARTFKDIAGFSFAGVNLYARDQASSARAMIVSGSFFSTLGLDAALGRVLTDQDDQPGAVRAIVISDRVWERQFSRDPGAVGSLIAVNRMPYTIVGILKPEFMGISPGSYTDVYAPMAHVGDLTSGNRSRPDFWWVQLIGRLEEGATDEQARTTLDVLLARVITDFASKLNAKFDLPTSIVVPGRRGIGYWDEQTPVFMTRLMVLVGLVLLIACANLSNLLLSRANARSREIAIRASIGAGRGRLIRQFVTESLTLSLLGGLLGLAVAHWSKALLIVLLRQDETNLAASLDARVLTFTIGVSVLTGLIFGVIPAMRATRGGSLEPVLKQTAGVIGFGPRRQRVSQGLVAAQMALSLLLLVGAGLFVRTLMNLSHLDVGFRTDHMLLFNIDPVSNGYQKEAKEQLLQRVRAKVAEIPGVQAVTLTPYAPLSGSGSQDGMNIPGIQEEINVSTHLVGSGHLAITGTPLLAGRDIQESDSPQSQRVAIVNQDLAQKYFNGNALGKTIVWERKNLEIVGIAKNTRHLNLRRKIEPTLYAPFVQHIDQVFSMFYEVKTTAPPLSIVPAVRRVVSEIDPTLPITDLKTQEQQVDEALAYDRTFALVSSFFSGITLLLASIGVYGLLAYSVSRRTNEMGIRLALGAGRQQLLWLVLRESLTLVAIGIVIGVPGALAAATLVKKTLYGVQANDFVTLIISVLTLSLVAALATWIPARRASRVDPLTALRYE